MNKIKLLLLKLLGEQKYLFFVATTFQRLFATGKLGQQYQDVYFLNSFIKKGDACIDIGAHLGYYTFELSRLVGAKGTVQAVEPVGKFFNVLKRIISARKIENIELHKVALGGEGKVVEIGFPLINKQKKFGWARLREINQEFDYADTEKVANAKGDEFFGSLEHIDFIKCDVEGAEVAVFKSMPQLISKHKPVLLLELADKNERIKMMQLVANEGYQVYHLHNKLLKRIDVYSDEKAISHNHYFIPDSKLSRFENLINA